MSQPALQHVQGDALYDGMDAKPMTEPLRVAVRSIRDAGLDHDPFHDLPDPNPADIPYRGRCLPTGLLGLADPVSGVQSIEKI